MLLRSSLMLGFAAGMLGLPCGGLAAERASVTAAASALPVALPPFIVEEPTKGPPWRYAEAMGYEVLSRCSDATTKRVVEAHYRLHQLLEEVLPPELQLKLSVPRTLILYDEELQPAASKEVIAHMLRTPAGPEPASPAPFPGARGLRANVPVPQFSFLPNLRLWDRDAMSVFMIVRREDFDADRLSLTPDYISYRLKNRLPTLPPWFHSGFISFFGHTTFESRGLVTEPLSWLSPVETAAVKTDPQTAPPLLPLDDFFAARVGPPDPAASFDPVRRWQAQAELFLRWGLDSEKGTRRQALWRFVDLSSRRGASEALFQECFALDYAAAQTELAAYLPQAVRRTLRFRQVRVKKLPPLALRNATDSELGRIKGDWERLEIAYVKAIAPVLAQKYLDQARRTLQRAYERGARDSELLAVMGLCEVDAGEETAAREYLETAALLGPMRPRAWYELARLRLAEFRTLPGQTEHRITAEQAAAVLRPLFTARESDPPLPEVYELIAEVWENCAVAPNRGHLLVLDEGVRFFPRQSSLVYRAAELNLRNGFQPAAIELVTLGLNGAGDEATRQQFLRLQDQVAK